jgi:hypothetical protein
MHARSGCNPITHYITKTQHKQTGGNWQLATGWRVAASEAPGIIQAPKTRIKEAIRAGGTACLTGARRQFVPPTAEQSGRSHQSDNQDRGSGSGHADAPLGKMPTGDQWRRR